MPSGGLGLEWRSGRRQQRSRQEGPQADDVRQGEGKGEGIDASAMQAALASAEHNNVCCVSGTVGAEEPDFIR